METSDSECFESADEEFMSESNEEDITIETKRNKDSSKQVLTTLTKIDSNSEADTNTTEKSLEDKQGEISDLIRKYTAGSSIVGGNKLQNVEREEISKPVDNTPNRLVDVSDISGSDTNLKVDGYVDNKLEHSETEKNVSERKTIIAKTHIDKVQNEKSQKKYQKTEETIRQPKQQVDSVKQDLKTNIEDKKDELLEKHENNISVAECWEPGVNYDLIETEKNNDDNNEENMWENEDDWGESFKVENESSSKNMKTECWEPGVNYDVVEKKSNLNEENLWDDDEDWEPVEESMALIKNEAKEVVDVLENLSKQKENESSWGAWGGWGLSSVLSTATASVSTLTSHVSHGISSVLESGIGVPDPEELARLDLNEHKKDTTQSEEHTPNMSMGLGLGNLVSGVTQITKLMEQTSSKVISGGLDTLETIGKKTMEVLQENDPGLKKKRAFLKLDAEKPILSQILREAKEKAEEESQSNQQRNVFKKPNYEAIFDDFQGLVHLEALEMLSKQCDLKLQTLSESLSGNTLTEMQETMEQVRELCELPEEDEESSLNICDGQQKLESITEEINISFKYSSLIETWEEIEDWFDKNTSAVCNENEIHKQAIESLAHLTAISVEQYHKIGELLLVKDHRSTADEADSLVQLTSILSLVIRCVAGKFTEKLTAIAKGANNKDAVNELITNVFFEAENSTKYIQDAFQLLIPVLQVGAV